MTPGTLGIVGIGLIGGSIGAAARERGWRVLGYDVQSVAQTEALEARVVDGVCSRRDVYERSDVVAIAAYADGTLAELDRLERERPQAPQLIIDVASVKRDVARAGASVPNFVATHPMAGTEKHGPKHARGDLFAGRTWAYVPTGDESLDARAHAFIASLGALPLAVDADEHDRTLALTSHATQLLATAYRAQVREARGVEELTGATARELLRLGSAPLAMWEAVFAANGPAIARELHSLAATLDAAADALATGDRRVVAQLFERVSAAP